MKPGVCDNFKFGEVALAKIYRPAVIKRTNNKKIGEDGLTRGERGILKRRAEKAERARLRKLALDAENKVNLALEKTALEIIERIAKRHGLQAGHITGERRSRYILNARLEAYDAVFTKYPNFSLPRLGKIFGGRDHTTMLYGQRKVETMKQRGEWPPL